jgi:hypothetical protein
MRYNPTMSKTDPVDAKLARIQPLWTELQREIPNGPSHEALAERIQALSEEYEALIVGRKKPEETVLVKRDPLQVGMSE